MLKLALVSLILSALVVVPEQAAAQPRIAPGQQVEGRLTTSDRRDSLRRYQDEYVLSGEAAGIATLRLRSSARMFLTVVGGGSTRSVAVRSGVAEINLDNPSTREFRVRVTGAARNVTGRYQLEIVCSEPNFLDEDGVCSLPEAAPAPPPPPPPPPPLERGFPEVPDGQLRRFTLLPGDRYGPTAEGLPFGIILLRQGDAERNQALCERYVSNIGQGGDDSAAPVIATYWLLAREVGVAGQSNCQTLLANYDYTRAARIMGEYNHRGAGPVLLALQIDSNAAQPDVFLLDMSRHNNDRIREIIGDWYTAVRSGVSEPRRSRNILDRVLRVLGGLLDWVRGRACRLVDDASGQVRGALNFVDTELGLSGTIVNLAQGNQIVTLSTGVVRRICGRPEQDAGPSPQPSPPTGGSGPIDGTLSETDQRLPENQAFYDEHSVTLTAGRQVTIDLASSAFDPVLRLYRGQELVAQNDDHGGGRDSRIVFTPTVSGSYRILPSSYSPGETGAYRLTIRHGN